MKPRTKQVVTNKCKLPSKVLLLRGKEAEVETLPKKFKARWIKALRSGKFLQGRGELRSRGHQYPKLDAYCCLGVALKISSKSKRKLPRDLGFIPDSCRIVPKSIVGRNRLTDFLSFKNDKGTTFAEIADWIDKNL